MNEQSEINPDDKEIEALIARSELAMDFIEKTHRLFIPRSEIWLEESEDPEFDPILDRFVERVEDRR